MGYSRKEELAKLRRARREAKAAKKRQESVRDRHVRFLIVCEGSKTEPYYFRSLVKNYESSVREETIKGEGRATVALVERALSIKQSLELSNAMSFDRVWVVFDKDDFDDFNDAIKLASESGLLCAWTNEAFELWYCLHFEYLQSGIGRDDYIDKLNGYFRDKMQDPTFKYDKGNPQNYNLLRQYGSEDLAKRYAQKLREFYTDTNYDSHNPCTMVDLLVEELEHPENLLKE